MEYKIDLDNETTQQCLNAFIQSMPLGSLANQINQDIFSRKTSDNNYLYVRGIEKNTSEALKILPEISRFSRPCYFGQQVVRILGPVDPALIKNTPIYSAVNPHDLSIFVSSEGELEKITQNIAKEGKDLEAHQHQFWFGPYLQFLQQNTYTSKGKKLFRSSWDLQIKPEFYGFNICGFGGPMDHVQPIYELSMPMLKRFIFGYLGFMEEKAKNGSSADYYATDFKKHDWCILPWNKNFVTAAENNLTQLGLTKVNKIDGEK